VDVDYAADCLESFAARGESDEAHTGALLLAEGLLLFRAVWGAKG
jgi:hypothetical protein